MALKKKSKKKIEVDAIHKNRNPTRQTRLSGFYHAEARS